MYINKINIHIWENFVFLVPINKLRIQYNQFGERQDRLWKWTMYMGQMHRDGRLQMREELHSMVHCGRAITFRGRAACFVWQSGMCTCTKLLCSDTLSPLPWPRVSGKRLCHAKVHNNRGATVISWPTVTTNYKSFAEAVEFSFTITFRANFM